MTIAHSSTSQPTPSDDHENAVRLLTNWSIRRANRTPAHESNSARDLSLPVAPEPIAGDDGVARPSRIREERTENRGSLPTGNRATGFPCRHGGNGAPKHEFHKRHTPSAPFFLRSHRRLPHARMRTPESASGNAMNHLEDEESWLRGRIIRLRTIMRYAKDPRVDAGLSSLTRRPAWNCFKCKWTPSTKRQADRPRWSDRPENGVQRRQPNLTRASFGSTLRFALGCPALTHIWPLMRFSGGRLPALTRTGGLL